MKRSNESKSIFLRASRDIQTVKQHGRRISTPLFNLLAYKMDGTRSRVGIIVGKRFGTAVQRNRAKRVFRELARHMYQQIVPEHALLVFPKREALVQPSQGLQEAWAASLSRMRLLRVR